MSGPLAALWSARRVAIVGASDRASALGRLPVEFLQRYGYSGEVLPVRPDGRSVLGLRSYPSVDACPGPVDLAMIMVAADRVPAAVDDCVKAGVPVAIVCSSGFAETGADGARLQDEVVERARTGGLRLVGPNCIGSVGVPDGQVSSFSPLFGGERTRLVDGPLGFVSQSGALGFGAVSLAFERGVGLGRIVNTGNEADVTALEVMAAIAAEPGCRGVLGYLESLDDAAGLRAVADSGVPAAVIKAGRSAAGAEAAASHTGALATGDRVVDAALRQYGIARAYDVEELIDIGAAFAQPRSAAGPRVAVITTSGGSGILAADAVDEHGLELAELSTQTRTVLDGIVPAFGSTANPVDITATVMSDITLFERSVEAVVDDDGVDVLVACFCVLTGQDVDDIVASLRRAAERTGKPVLVARTGAEHLAPEATGRLRDAGIPAYPTPARAVRAAAALHQVGAPRRGSGPLSRREPSSATSSAPPAGVSEYELKALLGAAGLPVPLGRVVTDRDDAAQAVGEVGGRAVLKAQVPGVVHKTEAGAVVLDATAAMAPEAFDRLAGLGGTVVVEEMVGGGVEVLVGVTPSPLGPVLTVGPGGTLTEVLDDVSLRLLPVHRDDVEQMVDETRLGRLLAGVRGAARADRAALVEAVARFAELVGDWPAGFELDLNPVTVLAAGDGVRILDAAYVAPPSGGR